MKAINAIFVSVVGLGLGACAISIEGEGARYGYDASDYMTVTLPNGDKDSFSCPEGTSAFVVNKKEEDKGMVYGCRTNDAPMPSVGE